MSIAVAHLSSNISSLSSSPTTTTTTTYSINPLSQAISNYGFISVFPSVEIIRQPAFKGPNQKLFMQPLKNKIPWACIKCDNRVTFGPKCDSCGSKREHAAIRVFVGKLNREGAAETCAAILSQMCDPFSNLSSPVLHIEPHTHSSTRLGKGCCWIYARTPRDVQIIVAALHERTFVAVHPQTGEVGFIPFPTSCNDAEIEAAFQNDHFTREHFVHFLLHSAKITAEIPTNMKDEILAKSAPLHTTYLGESKNIPSSATHQRLMTNVTTDQKQNVDVSINNDDTADIEDDDENYDEDSELTTTSSTTTTRPLRLPLPPRPVFKSKTWFGEDANGNVLECLDDEHANCSCAACLCGCPPL